MNICWLVGKIVMLLKVPQLILVFSCPLCFPLKNWNYFGDNESDSVKMMEDVEKLCDRLELVR